jgi:predicted ATPase
LTGGARTALPRQQTLRSLIDWSYDLLRDSEKLLLQQLSVFAGGWTLDAAERICAGDHVEDGEVLDLLTSLIDKSLVALEEGDGRFRYRLLETVRQYARERPVESGAPRPFGSAIGDYFVVSAEDAEQEVARCERQWPATSQRGHDTCVRRSKEPWRGARRKIPVPGDAPLD